MYDGICRSCGSATVHSGTVTLANGWIFLLVGMRRRRVKTVDYVCVSCGYFAKHVLPGKVLDRVAERWPYVSPSGDERYPG